MHRKFLGLLFIFVLAAPLIAQQPGGAGTDIKQADLKTKVSYIIGSNIGRQMKQDGLDLDVNTLMRGLNDGMLDAKSPFTEQEVTQIMTQFQQIMQQQQAQKANAVGDKNKQEGAAFLAQNKAAEGVKVLPSGLQYKVLKAGTGATPKATDQVTTHYRGTLINGTVFDSSYDRGQPATFPVNGVIKGWTEALQLMKVGDKWQLFVPSELAYGERGAGADIGPSAVLIFEVELLGIGGGR